MYIESGEMECEDKEAEIAACRAKITELRAEIIPIDLIRVVPAEGKEEKLPFSVFIFNS